MSPHTPVWIRKFRSSLITATAITVRTVVGPTAEFHVAALLVKREPGDVNFARRLVNGRRLSNNLTGVIQTGLGHQSHLVLSISTKQT